MTLKAATKFAITGIALNLFLALITQGVLTFDVLTYSKYISIFRILYWAQILLLNVPLIIFFIVLYRKQN